MKNLYTKFCRAVLDQYENKENELQNVQNNDNLEFQRFTFRPGKTVTDQLINFEKSIKRGKWNQEISIKGYKGTFKIEHWIYIEQKLRQLSNFQLIQFIDTQLDKEHLNVLSRLINWINPQDFSLILKQNEVDDYDVKDFIEDLIRNSINFKKLVIKSNPGIYKGHFLLHLEEDLAHEQLFKRKNYYYKLIKNQSTFSISIVKILKSLNEDEIDQIIRNIEDEINQSCFFDLNLSNCFTASNCQGLYYLLEQLYHEDHLEQLVGLDISNNILGEIGSFSKACSLMSTSKGLLKLEIGNQPLLHNSVGVESLCGNRYDQLRLSTLNISSNDKMSPKAFEFLCNNIVSKSLKQFQITSSLPGELPTLLKIFYIIEAYEKELVTLRSQLRHENRLYKLNLEELDLSTVENYNRHDLMYKLLASTVFNEFSSVQKLIISNCDAGRMEAYYKAYIDFTEHVTKNKNNQLYKNFRMALTSIVIPQQRYSMTKEINLTFLLKIVFTTNTDILQIQSVKFIESNNIEQRNEAFREALEQISDNAVEKQYTLKHFVAVQMRYYFEMKDIKSLLCNSNLQLESFYIEDTSCVIDPENFENMISSHIQQLELHNQFYSLKSFTLKSAYGTSIELFSFIQLLIMNDKAQLKELNLASISITLDEKKQEALEELIKQQQNVKELKILSFGSLDGDNIYPSFFKYIVLNKWIRLSSLTLLDMQINDFLTTDIEPNIDISNQDHQLSQLRQISLQRISLDTESDWKSFSSIFFFNKYSTLQEIEFNTVTITQNMQKGLESTLINVLNQVENIKSYPKLRKLKIDSCEIQTEFLILYCYNPFCRITDLEIKNCVNFDKYLLDTKEMVLQDKLQATFTASISSFSLISTEIVESFGWFFSEIIFNSTRQKLTTLTLQGCSLSDEQLNQLARIIQILKNTEKKQQIKRYFRLREINFSENQEISEKQWKKLFNTILDVDEKDDKQKLKENKEDIVDVQQQLNEDQNQLQDKIEENNSLIQKSNLNISDKILQYPNEFIFLPPQQLQYLDLDLNFTQGNEPQKIQIYKSIICGLIAHSQSQLVKLKLSTLDLGLFMNSFEEMFQFAQLHQKNRNQNQAFHYQLKDIEIVGMINQSAEAMKLFVKYFICSEHIDLVRLSVTDSESGLVKELLEQCPQKAKYSLKELRLINIVEELTKDLSILFIKYVIFGEKFPIQTLEFGERLIMRGKINSLDCFGKERYEGEIQLKDLTLFCVTFDIDRIFTINYVINEILSNPTTNLEVLKVTGERQDSRCFDLFYEKGMKEIQQVKIEKLLIENNIVVNEKFLCFLSKCRQQLKELKLVYIESCDESEQLLSQYKSSDEIQECKLEVQQISGNEKILQELFCFNKEFNFTTVIHNDLPSFNNNFSIGNGFLKIKSLRFSFNLYYNDAQQLDNSSLTLIGKYFIYNNESKLEELTLHQCHLKPEGLRALTSSAEEYRQEVANLKIQSSATLSLKRLNIYYSLYVDQEGAEIINKDILFFEYINIERIELQVTNWNSEQQIHMCNSALNWLKFQKQHQRQFPNYFPLKYFDVGRNEFVATEEAWKLTCQTFFFTNLTPRLEILNMHFMALTDATTEMITQAARTYFNKTSSNYIYQVKRLSFSHNSSLTHQGWLDVSQNLFFHPKVELEELNISDTNLDNNQKISNIVTSAISKALTKPNQKLTLHTLLTFNTVVKQQLQKYLSQQPSNYGSPPDLPVEIDYNSLSEVGYFGGTPEEFGQYNQCQNNIIYNYKTFKTSEWTEKAIVKLPQYHLSLADNYIRPLNQFYREQGMTKAALYFNLSTLDLFCNIFKYTTEEPGCPYPYTLLFQKDTFNQLKKQNSIIQHIILINAQISGLEKINHHFILFVWENIKSKQSSIDQIVVDYYLDDDLIDSMFSQGYTEADIVSLIRLIPPSKIRIQNTLSLQAIKALYSIFYDTQHFQYSQIQFDFDNFLNIGIGYALREVAYNMKARGCKQYFKILLYKVCDFFVKDTQQYQFNSEVTDLNKYLSTKHFYFFSIALTNLFFISICILSPYFFSHFYENDSDLVIKSQFCISGPSKFANYMYYSFAVVTLLLEAYVYKNVTTYVPSFVSKLQIKVAPKEEDDGNVDEKAAIALKIGDQPAPIKKSQTITNSILKSTQTQLDRFTQSSLGYWLNFSITMVTSQLAKYDFFNDICFILTCFYCDELVLFWIALAVCIFNWSLNILSLFYLIVKKIFRSDDRIKQLSTEVINDFYKMSRIGRNIALINLLDQVAPFNVDIIPNNRIMRFIFPNQAGKAINSSIKGYLLQFLFEDLPQILILLIFLVRQALKTGGLKWNIILTLVTSSVTVLLSFHKFMSIRPSYLSQEHFDKLSELKLKEYQQFNLKLLEQETQQLTTFSELFQKQETDNNRYAVNESGQLL